MLLSDLLVELILIKLQEGHTASTAAPLFSTFLDLVLCFLWKRLSLNICWPHSWVLSGKLPVRIADVVNSFSSVDWQIGSNFFKFIINSIVLLQSCQVPCDLLHLLLFIYIKNIIKQQKMNASGVLDNVHSFKSISGNLNLSEGYRFLIPNRFNWMFSIYWVTIKCQVFERHCHLHCLTCINLQKFCEVNVIIPIVSMSKLGNRLCDLFKSHGQETA